VVGEEALERLLREGECATDVLGERGSEGIVRLGQEGLFGRVLDGEDGDGQSERGEGWVRLDGSEGAGQVVGLRVGGEAFDDGAGDGGPELGGEALQRFGTAGEQGDGQVAVGWRSQNACDSCALAKRLWVSVKMLLKLLNITATYSTGAGADENSKTSRSHCLVGFQSRRFTFVWKPDERA
jgi:hypothetical protein